MIISFTYCTFPSEYEAKDVTKKLPEIPSRFWIRVSSPVKRVDKEPDRVSTEPENVSNELDKLAKFCSSVVFLLAIEPDNKLIELENKGIRGQILVS